MEFDVAYAGEHTTESRKMRTTLGPGFTTFKQSYKATFGEGTPGHNFHIEEALNRLEDMPEELKLFGADEVRFTCFAPAFVPEMYATLHVTYQERGHWKRAELGKKLLARLRRSGADLSFIVKVVAAEAERYERQVATQKAADKLRSIASQIVTEASRRARAEVDYEGKMTRLNSECDRWRENIAIDLSSQVSRKQGLDEAELKIAVEERLSAPSFEYYLGRAS